MVMVDVRVAQYSRNLGSLLLLAVLTTGFSCSLEESTADFIASIFPSVTLKIELNDVIKEGDVWE